jgi:hypothetical protein
MEQASRWRENDCHDKEPIVLFTNIALKPFADYFAGNARQGVAVVGKGR